MSKPSLIRRIFSAIWSGITWFRLALSNILFILLILVIYFVYLGGPEEPIPEKAALLLNISGTVVDQKSQIDPLRALTAGSSPQDRQVLLRDVIESIQFAKDDPAINSLVMDLNNLSYVGISKTQEIAEALEAFKASGKPIVAKGDLFTQDQFLLASHADTVIMNPLGAVGLEGYSSYRNYFRETLEKLRVSMHVFHAGEFKSMAEPFLRDGMSQGEKAITERWLNVLWGQYAATVEAQRDLPPGSVNSYVNDYAASLAQRDGDVAAMALDAGLVDMLMNRHETNEYLVDLVGASNEDGYYEVQFFERYVRRQRPTQLTEMEGDRVAVISAVGNINNGVQPPGSIGGDSLARLIRDTAEKDGVRALVLRINTGGGSVFASEVIRQQLLLVQADGLPVVVSMGALAASGGYYIAADADEIWATPSTLTGSIGVYAAIPTFERLLEYIGTYTDGVGTTDMAGSLRLDRPLNPMIERIIRMGVDHTYDSFRGIVAEGRDMTYEEVEDVAEGRVWSAPDALENGLLDGIGSLSDAIAAAAARADLSDYKVEYVQPQLSPRELLLKAFAERVTTSESWSGSAWGASMAALIAPVTDAASELANLNDPRHLYFRCFDCGLIR
ncbi:MAG: signal peptide peptidase SppA [Pseudomonadota bacterium]